MIFRNRPRKSASCSIIIIRKKTPPVWNKIIFPYYSSFQEIFEYKSCFLLNPHAVSFSISNIKIWTFPICFIFRTGSPSFYFAFLPNNNTGFRTAWSRFPEWFCPSCCCQSFPIFSAWYSLSSPIYNISTAVGEKLPPSLVTNCSLVRFVYPCPSVLSLFLCLWMLDACCLPTLILISLQPSRWCCFPVRHRSSAGCSLPLLHPLPAFLLTQTYPFTYPFSLFPKSCPPCLPSLVRGNTCAFLSRKCSPPHETPFSQDPEHAYLLHPQLLQVQEPEITLTACFLENSSWVIFPETCSFSLGYVFFLAYIYSFSFYLRSLLLLLPF